MTAKLTRAAAGEYALAGELSFGSVPGLWQQSRQQLSTKDAAWRIDLQAVERSDSAGLALLLAWVRDARRHSIELSLSNPPAQLREIAGANGLQGVLLPETP
ncbi:MAG: STAS domain-containing protein [Gammaproteobacteria bacterium]